MGPKARAETVCSAARPAARAQRTLLTGPRAQRVCLVDAHVVACPLALAEDVLLYLPGRGLRERAELNRDGTLVVGDVVAAAVDDLALGRRPVVLERHERLRALAPFLIWGCDDSALQHGRVAGDRVLDLDGRNVLAAGDDHVLLTVA